MNYIHMTDRTGAAAVSTDLFLAKPIVISANIQRRENLYKFSKHIHENLEIYLINSGLCEMEIGKQQIRCHTGDFVLVLPNIPHSFYLPEEGDCEFMHIHFSPHPFSEMLISSGKSVDLTLLNALEFAAAYGTLTFHFQADSYLTDTVTKLIHEANADSELSMCCVNLYLTEILLHILKIQKTDFTAYSPAHKVQNNYVNFALQYIRENFDKKILIDEVAAKLNISNSYLRRIFNECMHINLSAYLQIFRINKSVELMTTTDMSLTEIAIASGLSDAQYFSKLFRNTMGISPLKYRKLRQF